MIYINICRITGSHLKTKTNNKQLVNIDVNNKLLHIYIYACDIRMSNIPFI